MKKLADKAIQHQVKRVLGKMDDARSEKYRLAFNGSDTSSANYTAHVAMIQFLRGIGFGKVADEYSNVLWETKRG